MSRKISVTFLAAVFFFLSFSHSIDAGTIKGDRKSEIANKMLELRVPFIENKGQIENKSVRYYANTFGGTFFITNDGAMVYSLLKVEKENNGQGRTHTTAKKDVKGWAIRESLVGALAAPVEGGAQGKATVNYFKGKDPAGWRSKVPTYDSVSVGEVYKDIELDLKAYGSNVEKLFTVKPKADASKIKVRIEGAKELRVNKEGELEVETGLGPVKFTKPVAYQIIGGKKVTVSVEYLLLPDDPDSLTENGELKTENSKHVYAFKVGDYDRTKELVIDPLMASTFLGGSNYDIAKAVFIDPYGFVYVCGETVSADFPTPNNYGTSFQPVYGGNTDAFVSFFDAGLSTLLASTYLGGSYEDWCESIYVGTEAQGVYITGGTGSNDFPTVAGCYDVPGGPNGGYNGGDDAFVSKLTTDLTSLPASTFLGANLDEWGEDIFLSTAGRVYVTGGTWSSGFPTTPGVVQTIWGGSADAFVSQFSPDLTALGASTFLGGSDFEWGHGMFITQDAGDFVYITGETASGNFPTTPAAYDTSFNGVVDAFVSVFNPLLSALGGSTYLGGNNSDAGWDVNACDMGAQEFVDIKVYVTGATVSNNFPTVQGCYDTGYNGGYDAFVTELRGNLSPPLLASTYLGGSLNEWGESIDIYELAGHSGECVAEVFVTGGTNSTDFPTPNGTFQTYFGGSSISSGYEGDAFVSKFFDSLSTLFASTYLGGLANDWSYSIDLDAQENVYVAGETSSVNFPVTVGAYDTAFNYGLYDAFVSLFDNWLSSCTPVVGLYDAADSLVSTHTSISSAYTAASSGDKIKAAVDVLTEILNFNSGVSITLSGGWDCNAWSMGMPGGNPSYTTINGSLTISGGTVIVDRIVL